MSKDTPNFRGHFPLTTRRRRKRRDMDKWRRPRGIDSSIAKPRGLIPKIGYGHKNEDKFKHPCSLKEVLVCSKTDFDNISLEESVVIRFSATLGKKKREDLKKLAQEKNIKVLN